MWFGLRGSGAFSHADAYNEMTLSLQLRGVKTWRIAMHPAVHSAFDSFSSTDGGIYNHKPKRWLPEYEFQVHPGQCFIFPPGYFHETLIKEEDNPDDSCTFATTFQFNAPLPARYWRLYLPRWMNSHLGWAEKGDVLWGSIATLGFAKEATLEEDVIRERVSDIFKVLDNNKDGTITRHILRVALNTLRLT